MGKLTIRQKIQRSKLSASERLLRKEGIVEVSVQGEGSVLTDLGRRVVLDKLWQDDALRKEVLADVQAANKAFKAQLKEDKEEDE